MRNGVYRPLRRSPRRGRRPRLGIMESHVMLRKCADRDHDDKGNRATRAAKTKAKNEMRKEQFCVSKKQREEREGAGRGH